MASLIDSMTILQFRRQEELGIAISQYNIFLTVTLNIVLGDVLSHFLSLLASFLSLPPSLSTSFLPQQFLQRVMRRQRMFVYAKRRLEGAILPG